MSKEALTAAFNAGAEAARAGLSISSRLRYSGKAREFFEAGHFGETKKMKEEERAYRNSPEGIAARKAQREADAAILAGIFGAITDIELAEIADRRKRAAAYEAAIEAAERAANR